MAPPRPALMWPVVISAGVRDSIPFYRGGAKTATITAATYYTPSALAAAVQAALTAADGATTWAVSVSAAGRFSISASAAFFLSWAASSSAAEAQELLGWNPGTTAPGTVLTADHQHQNGWYADDPVSDDTGERPVYLRAQTVALSGRARGLTNATRYQRTIALGFLAAWKVWPEEEGASHLNEAMERLLEAGWTRFRWFPDQLDLATGTDYTLDLEAAKRLLRSRFSPGAALYSLSLTFRKYV